MTIRTLVGRTMRPEAQEPQSHSSNGSKRKPRSITDAEHAQLIPCENSHTSSNDADEQTETAVRSSAYQTPKKQHGLLSRSALLTTGRCSYAGMRTAPKFEWCATFATTSSPTDITKPDCTIAQYAAKVSRSNRKYSEATTGSAQTFP